MYKKINFDDFCKNFFEAIEIHNFNSCDPHTKFRELESWDSFSAMSLIAMIDTKYGITLSADDMNSQSTLLDLYEIISVKKS